MISNPLRVVIFNETKISVLSGFVKLVKMLM